MEHSKQLRSEKGLEVLGGVRRICSALPEVVEETDGFGHSSFRVAKKPFVIMGEDADGVSLSIKTELETQDALIRMGRFYRTPYIGQHGWVSLPGDEATDWTEIETLVLEAYRRVAPKRLVRLLPED